MEFAAPTSYSGPRPRRLDLLVGRAVVSDTFRAGLLSHQRASLLHEWNVTPEDAAKVMAIRAETLETFAQGICRILAEGGADANGNQPSLHGYEH